MRIALIDGSNVFEAAKHIHLKMDYKKLLNLLNEDGQLLRAYYFTALREKSIISPVRKTVDWLKHNGYTCITKETKEYTDTMGVTKVKGNVDVDITAYAFTLAPQVDEIWLFSGDGDFTIMVKMLQEKYPLKVFVVSSIGLVATELRAQADKFITLASMYDDIKQDEQEEVA